MIKFIECINADIIPEHAQYLRDEWESTPYKVGMAISQRADPGDWSQLWDEYDERMGIITEGRDPTDADMLKAWESVLGIEL